MRGESFIQSANPTLSNLFVALLVVTHWKVLWLLLPLKLFFDEGLIDSYSMFYLLLH